MLIRQGDIFMETAKAPAGSQPVGHQAGRCVVGLGEVTGHQHVVIGNVQWLLDACDDVNGRLNGFAAGNQETMFLLVTGDAVLHHDEHADVTVDPGVWRVWRQREYTPSAIRSVVD